MTKQQSKKDKQDSISQCKTNPLTGDLFLQLQDGHDSLLETFRFIEAISQISQRGGIRALHCCSLKMPITLTWFWNIKYSIWVLMAPQAVRVLLTQLHPAVN